MEAEVSVSSMLAKRQDADTPCYNTGKRIT